MYTSARSKDLAFLGTRDDIYQAVGLGELDMISITEDVMIDKAAFPFVLPNTKRFVDSLAKEYHAGCGERLTVTSGARPIDEQPRNASPKSVHPTGMAVDFRKPNGPCLDWLRKNLIALEDRHVIEATEERHPVHFHVAVLQQAPERPRRAILASATSGTSAAFSGANPPSTGSLPRAGVASGDLALSTSPSAAQQPTAPVAATTPKTASTAPASKSEASKSEASKSEASSTAKSSSSGQTYRVKAGDNLWAIARHHGTTPEALEKLNDLGSNRLRVGQQLKLP